jgi:DivIVA domain-containing protein
MEMNPQRVRTVEFPTVRKGADPAEVKRFLGDVADELERAQNQATAMEARARAAVARLQEISEAAPAQPAVEASVEESQTISRTLVLAQRTADATVADAKSEAARILAAAKDEAAATLDSTREMSAKMLEDARIEARRIGDAERMSVASEVEALKARRDFLESDVHHLETFIVDQRARIREAATAIIDVSERVPGGLGDVRPPLLSASDDTHTNEPANQPAVDHGTSAPGQGNAAGDVAEPVELQILTDIADQAPGDDEGGRADEATQALPVVDGVSVDGSTVPGAATDEDFRFSFDDDGR